MNTKKLDSMLEKYKKDKRLGIEDKEYIYANYITYIDKLDNYDEYQKELILKYLRNMIVHTNKVLLIDELDNSIHNILQISKEKEILATNLKRYMSNRELNVNDLATRLHQPYSTVNDWVNGVSYPRRDKLRRLADVFNVSIRDLTEPHNENRKTNVIPVLGTIPARYTYWGGWGHHRLWGDTPKLVNWRQGLFRTKDKRRQYVSFL